jgi:hypothetical protein
MIIPFDSADPKEQIKRRSNDWQRAVIDAVRAQFSENRLLCTAINHIEIATAQPVVLHGEIAIDPQVEAERVVAEAIHRIRLLFKGLPAEPNDRTKITGSTRADVFDDAAAMWPQLPTSTQSDAPLEAALAALQRVSGLTKIISFDVSDPASGKSLDHLKAKRAIYHAPVLPQANIPFTLHVTRDGAPVQLSNDIIHEELGRLTAMHITEQNNRKNDADWDVLQPGKHRQMERLALDATLPAPYRIAEAKNPTAAPLSAYRSMMDAHLDDMLAPLKTLPDTFVGSRSTDISDPKAVRERVEVLDYLVSLHGEQMPTCDPNQLHRYRGTQDQLAWRINWREQYLAALPAYNNFAGTGHPTFGLLARLAHLADMSVGATDEQHALKIDDTLAQVTPPVALGDLILPSRPLDAFVTYSDAVDPLSLPKLSIACPWIVDNAITGVNFRRASQPDAYIVARNSKGDWDVLYQPVEGGGFHVCGSNRSRSKVNDWANRVRKTFAMLNQDAEQIWLVEDIQLREKTGDFVSFRATAVIPGWTARTSAPAYRLYVEDLIAQLAPAHVYVKPMWTTPAQMAVLQPLLTRNQDNLQTTNQALRHALQGSEQEAHVA